MRHVIVAGGSRGIGAACAALFREQGDRVSVLSRGDGVDLRDPDAAEAAIRRLEAEHGPADVLVCTAGAARQAPLAELTAASLREGMDAKYFTYVHAIMPVISGMAARGRGVIVNVIGMGGKIASATHLPGGAANAALMLLTAGLGNAYAGQGVRVVGVNPGPVATDRFGMIVAARAANEGITEAEARAKISAAFPAGRVPEAREVAEVVAFLASPAAGAINGTVIALDGAATPVI